jgi:hypothetical protein
MSFTHKFVCVNGPLLGRYVTIQKIAEDSTSSASKWYMEIANITLNEDAVGLFCGLPRCGLLR